MGRALWWRRFDDDPEPDHPYLPPSQLDCRYRIEVFGKPRAPWRSSPAEAMADAVELDLASWDGAREEHFLAVPVDMRVKFVGRLRGPT